jgi:hypothetical protein
VSNYSSWTRTKGVVETIKKLSELVSMGSKKTTHVHIMVA